MTETSQDVLLDSSTSEEPQTSAVTGPSTVISDVTQPDTATGVLDRPVENLKAEMDRKLGRVENRLAELSQLILSQAANRQPPPASHSAKTEYSDAELLDLAQSGSKEALAMLIERQVDAKVTKSAAAQAQQQTVQTSLGILFRKYPVLKDATHPLTQAALQAKAALLGVGYPDGPEVTLEAIKTAIADNPELVAQMVGQPVVVREDARRTSADTQQSIEGNRPRAVARTTGTAKPLSQKEVEIARRMGVKDPAGAKERFLKRNAEGRSTVSPTVAVLLREEKDA